MPLSSERYLVVERGPTIRRSATRLGGAGSFLARTLIRVMDSAFFLVAEVARWQGQRQDLLNGGSSLSPDGTRRRGFEPCAPTTYCPETGPTLPGMDHISPSANRISEALRALRQVYADAAADKSVLGLKCLQAVTVELAADGVTADDLKPLAELETLISESPAASATAASVSARAPERPPGFDDPHRDRRRKAVPSNTLLARSAVLIDLLVKDGQGEERAAQTVMRHLLLAGVPAPERGGNSRGWRRLREFCNTLHQGNGPEDACVEYEAFGRKVDEIPAGRRVDEALTERLWDRRRQARRDAG